MAKFILTVIARRSLIPPAQAWTCFSPYGSRLLAQAAINVLDERPPLGSALEGGIRHKPKKIAVRNHNPIVLHQHLANALPLHVIFDGRSGDVNASFILG